MYCVRFEYALLLVQHSSVPRTFHCFVLQVLVIRAATARGRDEGKRGGRRGWFCLSSVVDGSSFRGNGGEGGVGGTSGRTNVRTNVRSTDMLFDPSSLPLYSPFRDERQSRLLSRRSLLAEGPILSGDEEEEEEGARRGERERERCEGKFEPLP